MSRGSPTTLSGKGWPLLWDYGPPTVLALNLPFFYEVMDGHFKKKKDILSKIKFWQLSIYQSKKL